MSLYGGDSKGTFKGKWSDTQECHSGRPLVNEILRERVLVMTPVALSISSLSTHLDASMRLPFVVFNTVVIRLSVALTSASPPVLTPVHDTSPLRRRFLPGVPIFCSE